MNQEQRDARDESAVRNAVVDYTGKTPIALHIVQDPKHADTWLVLATFRDDERQPTYLVRFLIVGVILQDVTADDLSECDC